MEEDDGGVSPLPRRRVAFCAEQILRALSAEGRRVCPHCVGRMKLSLVARILLSAVGATAFTGVAPQLNGCAAIGFGAVATAAEVCRLVWISHFRKAE
jgi:hypothetical protein